MHRKEKLSTKKGLRKSGGLVSLKRFVSTNRGGESEAISYSWICNRAERSCNNRKTLA